MQSTSFRIVQKPLIEKDLIKLLHEAIKKDIFLKEKKIELKETEALINFSGGDARKLYNLLELAASQFPSKLLESSISEVII